MSDMLNGKTILLVEDEAIIAMDEAALLERRGCAVIVASSGSAAVDAVLRNPHIDLVLMDIDLGAGVDGTAAAERILAHREVPIVFLSSHTEPEVVERTEGITSYGYVVKDSGETVLLASIKMAFRLFAARTALTEKSDEAEAANEELGATIEELESTNEELARSQEELLQLTTLLEQVFEQSPVPMALVSMPDVTIRIANRACREFLGILDEPSPVGTSLPDFRPTFEDRDMSGALGAVGDLPLARSLRGERTVNEERIIVRKDGTTRRELVNAVPIVNERGEIIAGYLTLIDITERRKIEMMFEAIFRLSPIAIALTRFEDGRIVQANDRYCAMTGYRLDEIIGKTSLELNFWPHPGDRDTVKRILAKNGSFRDREITFRRKDGSLYDSQQSASVITIDGERYIIAATKDLSDERAMRETLQHREALITAISDNLPGAMIYQIDRRPDGTRVITHLSDTVRRFYGCSPEEAIADPTRLYGRVADEDTARLFEAEEEANRSLSRLDIEVRMIDPSGAPRWSHFVSTPALLPDGTTRWDGIEVDITERKRIEDELARSLAAQETLLRELRHRVMNSLSIIGSLAGMEGRATESAAVRAALLSMGGRIRSLAELYDMLPLSAAGEIRLDLYLRRIIDAFARSILHDSSRIVITATGDEISIDADRATTLGLIANELATNAVKYAFPDGRAGAVNATLRRDGIDIVLMMSDTGIGPPPGFSLSGGTGTGMSIVTMLARQLDGSVSFERIDGRTVFTVRVPYGA